MLFLNRHLMVSLSSLFYSFLEHNHRGEDSSRPHEPNAWLECVFRSVPQHGVCKAPGIQGHVLHSLQVGHRGDADSVWAWQWLCLATLPFLSLSKGLITKSIIEILSWILTQSHWQRQWKGAETLKMARMAQVRGQLWFPLKPRNTRCVFLKETSGLD